MDAAEALFVEQGVGPTTVDQITARAQVAKGTFYNHFTSKDEVVEALVQRFGQGLVARIGRSVGAVRGEPWERRLAGWIRACVTAHLDALRLQEALFSGPGCATRRSRIDGSVIDHLAGLLREGVAEGACAADDPRTMAVFLVNGVQSAVDAAVAAERRVNRPRLVAKIEALVLRVVRA